MASLDSLPADQRAVLQLVLQRGRTYDEIAKLLSIDRAAVRQRALSALDELGPQTSVPAERRAVIADYLLGQLPAGAGDSAREGMAHSPSERAWARIVASELSDMATEPLPAIPSPEGRSEREAGPEPPAAVGPAAGAAAAEPDPAAGAAPSPPPEPSRSTAGGATRAQRGEEAEEAGAAASEPGRKRAVSRRGGALLLGLAAAAVIAVVVVLLVTSGGSSKHNGTTAAGAAPTTTGSGTTTGKGTTSTRTQVLGQINLSPPTKGSKTAGIAEILKQGSTKGIAIVAQKVPKNSKRDAYAVWLYNSPADAHLLGFVNPGVTSNGRLSTAGALPTNASRFKQLIVTRETQATPKQPGTIILQGQLAGLS